ncbi:hypothetical protein ACFL6L_00340 [candidate division KSB1 bacterium]
MKKPPMCLLLCYYIITFVYCDVGLGNNAQNVIAQENMSVPGVISFESAFGSEICGTADEFLLVFPRFFGVTKNNAVLIWDENKIKVFNNEGKGIGFIGRRGEGPGEFGRGSIIPHLGPNDYITVLESSHNIYNAFDADFNLLEKKRIDYEKDFGEFFSKYPSYEMHNVNKIIMLSESEMIYELELIDNNYTAKQYTDKLSSYKEHYIVIIHKKHNAISELLFTRRTGYIAYSYKNNNRTRYGIYFTGIFGSLRWGITSNGKLVNVNTAEDTHDAQNGSAYTINLVSLDTFKKSTITHKFDVSEIPEWYINNINDSASLKVPASGSSRTSYKERLEKAKELNKLMAQTLRYQKYYPSISSLMIDRTHVFLFEYDNITKNEESMDEIPESDEIYVDVFDVDTEKFIRSVQFPFRPNIIRNGYAYLVSEDNEEFPVIAKYRISPEVYGK